MFAMTPWTDRAGRWFWPKALVFLATLLPAVYLAWMLKSGTFALPIEETTREAGTWALRLLLLSLAVTPIQKMTGWNRLILVRRLLGLAAFFYAAIHLWLYLDWQGYDAAKIAHELVTRIYLVVGLTALTGLTVLAATSSDWAIAELGPRWKRLHKIVYALAGIALFHFFLQTKIDASQATLLLGFFVLLMGYRLLPNTAFRQPLALLGVAAGAALVTVGLEALWYGLATGVNVERILMANLAFPKYVRPAWIVLITGAVASLLPLAGRRRLPRREPQTATAG
ncbi:MAG: protein-methionine-sulfoxide reductase heme-binding subunit MsrQ [Hyphomicrobiales bacterium]